MMDLFNRLLGRNGSKVVAKERLRFVLVHDRTNLAPETMEALRVDLIQVISKYMDIDQSQMDIQFAKENNSIALVANIPVQRVKR